MNTDKNDNKNDDIEDKNKLSTEELKTVILKSASTPNIKNKTKEITNNLDNKISDENIKMGMKNFVVKLTTTKNVELNDRKINNEEKVSTDFSSPNKENILKEDTEKEKIKNVKLGLKN